LGGNTMIAAQSLFSARILKAAQPSAQATPRASPYVLRLLLDSGEKLD
jgi:hypothetical protein